MSITLTSRFCNIYILSRGWTFADLMMKGCRSTCSPEEMPDKIMIEPVIAAVDSFFSVKLDISVYIKRIGDAYIFS